MDELEKGHKGRLRSVAVMPESLRSCQRQSCGRGLDVGQHGSWVGGERDQGRGGADGGILAHLPLPFQRPVAFGSSCWQVFKGQPFPFLNRGTMTQANGQPTLPISESPSVVNGFSQVSPGLGCKGTARNPLRHFCT